MLCPVLLLQELLSDEICIVTPSEPWARGCQLSLTFHEGRHDAQQVGA